MTRGLGPCAVLGLCLCATGTVSAITLVTVPQEVEIGKQANAQVRREVPELRDAEVDAYLQGIGRRLVASADGPRYPYSFHVANYREINAFALPGGPVWVHRGVFQAAVNESQVAGVLAHEIAHISQRHAADHMTKALVANLGLGLLSAVLGDDLGAGAARMAAGLLANGIFLKFSRDDEREADTVGLRMMARAGWDARGMVELFDILRREAQRNPTSVQAFFSSHPSPAERGDRLRADVARHHGGRRDSPQFQAIKARLQRMSPARAMPTS